VIDIKRIRIDTTKANIECKRGYRGGLKQSKRMKLALEDRRRSKIVSTCESYKNNKTRQSNNTFHYKHPKKRKN